MGPGHLCFKVWRRRAGTPKVLAFGGIAEHDRNLNNLPALSLTVFWRHEKCNSNEVADFKFLEMTGKFRHIVENNIV